VSSTRSNAEGRTVVLITHEPDVANHAKRVVQLGDGQVMEDVRQAPVDGLPPRHRARTQEGWPDVQHREACASPCRDWSPTGSAPRSPCWGSSSAWAR